MFYKLLVFLNGKKTYLYGFLTMTNSFVALKGLYDVDTMTYINGVITLFFGTAEYQTQKLGINRK